MANNSVKGQEKPRSQQYEAVIKETQWPIIYSDEYNISFCGLERLHPFDAGKWGRIFEYLKEAGMVREDTIVEPVEATENELLLVHTKKYLSELRWSMNVAGITEIPPVALMPNFVVQRKVLRPFRYQTSGTIMAGRLALERGWAINIGGGFHHCCATKGGGFYAYADITLCIRFAFEKVEGVAKVMIIDLDAHQGNGHERDFMNDDKVFILDVYNRSIYPHDGYAKRAIARKVELAPYTDDRAYLDAVRRHVEGALNQFEPDLVVYNAGTDILEGDPLGCLSVTAQGIIERDQIVFQKCRTRGVPVLMVTSGGYQRQTARIVADSVLNLRELGLISCDEAENAPLPELPLKNDRAIPAAPSLPHSQSDGGLFARFRRSYLSRSCYSSTSIASFNSPNAVNSDGEEKKVQAEIENSESGDACASALTYEETLQFEQGGRAGSFANKGSPVNKGCHNTENEGGDFFTFTEYMRAGRSTQKQNAEHKVPVTNEKMLTNVTVPEARSNALEDNCVMNSSTFIEQLNGSESNVTLGNDWKQETKAVFGSSVDFAALIANCQEVDNSHCYPQSLNSCYADENNQSDHDEQFNVEHFRQHDVASQKISSDYRDNAQ